MFRQSFSKPTAYMDDFRSIDIINASNAPVATGPYPGDIFRP